MIKNRITQVIFQTVYCVLAIIGLLNSLGYFSADFNENFYVYYTNLSNYICMGVMFVSLYRTIKKANQKEDGFCETAPTFNFMCVIMIMVTFFVYNILLADENTVVQYFTSQSNMIMHVILPIMFILNWVLFYKHDSLKWYQPLLSVIMPIMYVAFILIRASILKGAENVELYPYFFLNVDELGRNGFFVWIAVLFAVFVALGYLLYGLDRIRTIQKIIKKKKGNK